MQVMDFDTKPKTARAMKAQEVIFRAAAKKITWWQAGDCWPSATSA